MSETRSVTNIIDDVKAALDTPAISAGAPQKLLRELATAIELLEHRVRKVERDTDPSGLKF